MDNGSDTDVRQEAVSTVTLLKMLLRVGFAFFVPKGCVVVEPKGQKCINKDTHERRDLVWQL